MKQFDGEKTMHAKECARMEGVKMLTEIISMDGQQKQIETGLRIMHDIRNYSLYHYILKVGYRAVLDLGCGDTMRGIYLVEEKGLHYVGADDLEKVESICQMVKDRPSYKMGRLNYATIDITNPASVYRAAVELKGPISVISDGALAQFHEHQLPKVIENIRNLIRAKGGCWITTDFQANDYIHAVMQPFIGTKACDELLEPDCYSIASIKGERLLHQYDLNPHKAELYPDILRPESLNEIPEETASMVTENFNHLKIHIITAKNVEREEIPSDDSDGGLSYSCSIQDGNALLKLCGRLDNTTTPALLGYFKRELSHGEAVRMQIYCEKLTYLSNTGVRALTNMNKKLPEGITIINANRAIWAALEKNRADKVFRREWSLFQN